jgi:hypothetical protein
VLTIHLDMILDNPQLVVPMLASLEGVAWIALATIPLTRSRSHCFASNLAPQTQADLASEVRGMSQTLLTHC